MHAVEVDQCRICAHDQFDEILNLGEFAISGRFPGPFDPAVPSGPLILIKCQNCNLVQLRHNFELDELYRHNYGYQSGINQTMRSHLAGITKEVSELVGLSKGMKVLDIGANDGTLLKSYTTDHLKKFGVDPTIGQFRQHYTGDITTVEDYFCEEVLPRLGEPGSFDAVTSIAVIYDLPRPQELFSNVAQLLSKNGLWVFEQSYMPIMLENNSYDTICHEHLEYYALDQINKLTSENGLRVFDVQFNNMNGGSFRAFACRDEGRYEETLRMKLALAEEHSKLLGEMEIYRKFVKRITYAADNLKHFLEHETDRGKKILGYGASTKGNIVLQHCGLSAKWIAAIADRNPKKWGLKTPLTNIPIISEKEAREQNPDYFFVMPWHFKEEFLERESNFLESGGSFIFPLPELHIVNKSGEYRYPS